MKLKEKIEKFYSEIGHNGLNEESLSSAFKKLAPAFLYGGYIDVYNEFRVYIRTVEFYFHDEKERNKGVIDPIVYHRNGRLDDIPHVPNFPLLSLHAHASGFDIAFERGDFRASALIRKYAVMYRVGDTFQELKRFRKSKERKWEDDRSTYLYDIINGFSLDSECNKRIEWHDIQYTETEVDLFAPNPRRNVFEYDKNDEYEKDSGKQDYNKRKDPKKTDDRKWSFSASKPLIVK